MTAENKKLFWDIFDHLTGIPANFVFLWYEIVKDFIKWIEEEGE